MYPNMGETPMPRMKTSEIILVFGTLDRIENLLSTPKEFPLANEKKPIRKFLLRIMLSVRRLGM